MIGVLHFHPRSMKAGGEDFQFRQYIVDMVCNVLKDSACCFQDFRDSASLGFCHLPFLTREIEISLSFFHPIDLGGHEMVATRPNIPFRSPPFGRV